MQSFDSFARSMVRPSRQAPRRPPSDRGGATLSAVLSIGCALLPLGVMVHAFLLTA